MNHLRPGVTSAILIVLIALTFGLVVHTTRTLGMDRKYFSFRFMGQGQVIAAIGSLVPGEPLDYMMNPNLIDLSFKYWDHEHSVPLEQIVAEAAPLAAQPVARGWVLDDKGYVDLIRTAFRVFGVHRTSVFYTYFIFFAIPLVASVIVYRREPDVLSMFLATMVALYSVVPVLAVNDQLSGILEQRFFAVAGLLPLLALVFLLFRRVRTGAAAILTVIDSAALVFVYHCRNDSLWQFGVVGLTAVFAVALAWRRRQYLGRTVRRAVIVVVPLVALLWSLHAYKATMYNPQYFAKGYASHAYWHTVVIGLGAHPKIADAYQLALLDSAAAQLVGRTLVARGELTDEKQGIDLFNNDFIKYQRVAGEAAREIMTSHPFESAMAFLYYKPRLIIGELGYGLGLSSPNPIALQSGHGFASDQVRQERDLYWKPVAPLALLLLVAAAVPAAPWIDRHRLQLLLVALFIWTASASVPIVSIPLMYLMGPLFVTTTLVLNVVLLVLVARLSQVTLFRGAKVAG